MRHMWLRDRGFTLIEILMVVIIMAIAAMVVPMAMSRNSETISVPAAARMVVADLTYAQNVAQTQQKAVYVVLRQDGSVYTGYDLAYNTNPTATADWLFTADRGQWIARFGRYGNTQTGPGALQSTQLRSVTLPGAGVFGFDSQGHAIMNNGGTITQAATVTKFVIADPTNTRTCEVSVAPITGNVSMK